MATKSKGGLLLPVLIVVGLLAYFGGSEVLKWGEGVVDDLTGGRSDLAMASSAKSLVKSCATEQVIKERKCGDTKILVLDAERMPFIARNVQEAWSDGQPYMLTRNSALQPSNRAKACGSFTYKFQGSNGSCDEYPFATTDEGGNGARTEEVHLDEQRCQGGTVSRGYQLASIANGDKFLVVISHPDKIAKEAWQGQEVKPGAC